MFKPFKIENVSQDETVGLRVRGFSLKIGKDGEPETTESGSYIAIHDPGGDFLLRPSESAYLEGKDGFHNQPLDGFSKLAIKEEVLLSESVEPEPTQIDENTTSETQTDQTKSDQTDTTDTTNTDETKTDTDNEPSTENDGETQTQSE